MSWQERLLPGVRDGAQLLHVDTPADWARQGMTAGTPFALAHTFAQTGPFRPANTVRGIDNAVLAGSSTLPGVGVPTTLISGRLAADRVTGVDPQHHHPRPESPIAMIRTELDAAGIEDVRLRAAYRRCRQIAAENGRTYFLATRLLAPDQRPAVHALYGFARHADDILDELNPALDVSARADRLQALSDRFFAGGDHHDEPVLAAVGHTVRRYGIAADLFEDFLASMRMDLTVTDYPDRAGARPLHARFGGSHWAADASDTGNRSPAVAADEAAPYAAALGRAFQLTNFLRDIDEDLTRNRIYLPADELAAFGVDRELMTWCHLHRRTDARVRDALAAQHHITREIYRFAADGIALLAPRSRPCVATALTLYSEILDRIEDSDFSVFSHRATVGMTRRLQVAGGALLRSWRVRAGRPSGGRSARRDRPMAIPDRAWPMPGDHRAAGIFRRRRLPPAAAAGARGGSGRGGVSGLGRGGHRGRRVDSTTATTSPASVSPFGCPSKRRCSSW